MLFHPGYLLILLVIAVGASRAETAALLEVDAAPASAAVRPLPPGRKLVRLPALEYRIGISARCAENYVLESISIGIADTRRTLQPEELSGSDRIDIDITIPGRQIAPLPVDGFCLADGRGIQEILVDDAVTAHLSLRCSNGEGTSIIYASRPLAVALSCDTGDQGDSDSPILR